MGIKRIIAIAAAVVISVNSGFSALMLGQYREFERVTLDIHAKRLESLTIATADLLENMDVFSLSQQRIQKTLNTYRQELGFTGEFYLVGQKGKKCEIKSDTRSPELNNSVEIDCQPYWQDSFITGKSEHGITESNYRQKKVFYQTLIESGRQLLVGEIEYEEVMHWSHIQLERLVWAIGIVFFVTAVAAVTIAWLLVRFLRSAYRAKAMFDAVPVAILTMDATRKFTSANPAACEMFGYKSMAGLDDRVIIPDEFWGRHDKGTKNAIAGGQTEQLNNRSRGNLLKGKRSDGTLFPMTLNLADIAEFGEREFIGVGVDQTELMAERAEKEQIMKMYVEHQKQMLAMS